MNTHPENHTPESASLSSIFRRFKWRIALTFALLSGENVLAVLQPLVLGIAINDMLEQKLSGLLLFTGLEVLIVIIGTSRRMYDTRVYTGIYTEVGSETVINQTAQEVPLSTIVARGNLVKELVDFFEEDLTEAYRSVFGVVGALIMLGWFDIRLLFACLAVIVLIVVIYRRSEPYIWRYNELLNDELERQVNVVSRRSNSGIFRHFARMAKWRVRLSDIESINFGLIELILFGLILFTLYISVYIDRQTTGAIFAVLTYVLEFDDGIIMLPLIFQQFIRLKEITRRL